MKVVDTRNFTVATTPNHDRSHQHKKRKESIKMLQLPTFDALYREFIYPNNRWGIIARTVDNDEKRFKSRFKSRGSPGPLCDH